MKKSGLVSALCFNHTTITRWLIELLRVFFFFFFSLRWFYSNFADIFTNKWCLIIDLIIFNSFQAVWNDPKHNCMNRKQKKVVRSTGQTLDYFPFERLRYVKMEDFVPKLTL